MVAADLRVPNLQPELKLMVVVNNHNSLNIVDLCESLRGDDRSVEIHVACTEEIESRYAAMFNSRRIQRLIFPTARGEDAAFRAAVRIGKDWEAQLAAADGSARQATVFASISRWLRLRLLHSSVAYALREQLIVRRLRAEQRRALSYLKEARPDAVLSMSDRAYDYVEAPTLWAARVCGIRIILPYVAQFDISAALEYRRDRRGRLLPELDVWRPFSLYKLVSFLRLRRQVHEGCFFQAPYVLNANRRASTLSAYPWWVGNGDSDVVCVDSRHTAELYVRHRVNESKLAIVGHVAYDDVHESHRNRRRIRQSLGEQYRLPAASKIVVLSVPQYAEQGFTDWDRHWAEMQAILEAASSVKQSLLLSLHPRSDASSYRRFVRQYDCHVVERPLAQFIGAADLFLASNSTTFAWAALCGIPSLALWSPVRFLYSHLRSVRPVPNTSELPAAIMDCLRVPPVSFEEDWDLLSRDHVFDGQCKARFARLLFDAQPVPVAVAAA